MYFCYCNCDKGLYRHGCVEVDGAERAISCRSHRRKSVAEIRIDIRFRELCFF